jgi:hypothetical protein
MKKLSLLLPVFIAAVMVSCSKDDHATTPSQDLADQVSVGTWRVTYFYHNDMEVTGDFSGYSFIFGNSNVLTASNGINTYTGTWSVVKGNPGDDSPEDLDFIIGFASPDAFAELSEDWNIVNQSNVALELIHVSGGDGSTDYLTFEKN